MFAGVIGFVLLVVVAADAFITVFSSRGAGGLTHLWTRSVWRVLLAVHKRRAIHAMLGMTGPLLLLSIVFIWYVLLIIGWALIFSISDTSVINTDKQYVTDFWEKTFFVGVTLSTLGYGNLVPNGWPWTLLGNLTALSGTVLLTSALSYVVSVLAAGIERRELASTINNVGSTVRLFISRSWGCEDGGQLDSHLLNIASQIEKHAHKHVNYPILRYFHSEDWEKSPSRAVLLFSDAVFLVSHGSADAATPRRSLLHVCERSVITYLDQASRDVASSGLTTFDHDDSKATAPPRHLNPGMLEVLGFTATEPERFEHHWREYRRRRDELVKLCEEDGWTDIADETCKAGC